LKRAWESLRRSTEFQEDCHIVTASASHEKENKKHSFHKKWGVRVFDCQKSFADISGETATIQLDDPTSFDDLYRRLYGDSFYGQDRVVRCEQLNLLYGLLGPADFQRLSEIARGQKAYDAPLPTLQRHPPEQSKIQLTIDVDENLIAILYKVQFVLRAIREARVQAGKAEAIPDRVKQRLKTLEETLDGNLVGDGRRDFRQDDEIFRVWDLTQEGNSDSQIARKMWPDEYRRVGGRDTATGEKGPVIQRVHRFKARAKEWIQRFSEVVKDKDVIL